MKEDIPKPVPSYRESFLTPPRKPRGQLALLIVSVALLALGVGFWLGSIVGF